MPEILNDIITDNVVQLKSSVSDAMSLRIAVALEDAKNEFIDSLDTSND